MKTESKDACKNKNRNTGFLFLTLVFVALVGMVYFNGPLQQKGTTVVVTVNGDERYRCSLFTDKELPIGDANTLVIKDGRADMIFADCPDQICVKHLPISQTGESIICLPNKVVVTIESLMGKNETVEKQMDAIVK